jgi:hypothetical protein
LVSDLDDRAAKNVASALETSQTSVRGLQFIAIQASPEEQAFAGFWMMRDIPMA